MFHRSSWMSGFSQTVAVLVKNISSLALGMAQAYSTILIPALIAPGESFVFTTEGLSWVGSINYIFVPLGSLAACGVTQIMGRKRSIQLSNIPMVVAWLLLKFCSAEWQVLAALGLIGVAGGFLEAPLVSYVCEISQPSLRGVLSSISSVVVRTGIPIMFLLGTFLHWRTTAIVGCAVNVASSVCTFFVPESPHWLISKDRLAEARKSLTWLRGFTTEEAVEAEYNQIYSQVKKASVETRGLDDNVVANASAQVDVRPESDKATKFGKLKLIGEKSFLWPFSIVSLAFFFSQATGMTILQTYAVPIFQAFQVPIDKYYATVLLGSVEFIGTALSLPLIHFTGKRLLNFVSFLGMGICFVIVGVYAYLTNVTNITLSQEIANATTNVDHYIAGNDYTWVPLFFLLGGALFCNVGIKILPWLLTGELFPSELTAIAAGLCGTIGYIFAFAVNKTFIDVLNALKLYGIYWTHGALSFLGFIIFYFILPETEGKTLTQIHEHYQGTSQVTNSVYRGSKHERRKSENRLKKLSLADHRDSQI